MSITGHLGRPGPELPLGAAGASSVRRSVRGLASIGAVVVLALGVAAGGAAAFRAEWGPAPRPSPWLPRTAGYSPIPMSAVTWLPYGLTIDSSPSGRHATVAASEAVRTTVTRLAGTGATAKASHVSLLVATDTITRHISGRLVWVIMFDHLRVPDGGAVGAPVRRITTRTHTHQAPVLALVDARTGRFLEARTE